MPVLLSYSHQDKDFAERLAVQLVRQKARVWIDQWELKVGDSILERIQSAIKTASALLVVLSKASVASEWCRKELSAGLMRELEEKRVLVLPVLLEDCEIPVFLKEKKYADFRRDFDEGLRETLIGIAAVTSDTQGRVDTPAFHIDWGVEWGTIPDTSYYALRFTFIDHGEQIPYCVLTDVHIVCNEALSRRLLEYEGRGIGWLGRLLIVTALNEVAQREDVRTLVLDSSFAKTKVLHFNDPRSCFDFDATISSRRLGMDTGINTLVDWGDHIRHLLEDLSRDVSAEEREKLRRAISEGVILRGL